MVLSNERPTARAACGLRPAGKCWQTLIHRRLIMSVQPGSGPGRAMRAMTTSAVRVG